MQYPLWFGNYGQKTITPAKNPLRRKFVYFAFEWDAAATTWINLKFVSLTSTFWIATATIETMPAKNRIFFNCGVCCPRKKTCRLVLTTVVLWSAVVIVVFTFVLRPSKELLTKDRNYDVARAHSEILEKVPLTGTNCLFTFVHALKGKTWFRWLRFSRRCAWYISRIVFNI